MKDALASLKLDTTDVQTDVQTDGAESVSVKPTESVIDTDSVLSFFLPDTESVSESLPATGTTVRFPEADAIWFQKVREMLILNGAKKRDLSTGSIVRGCVAFARSSGLLETLKEQSKQKK